jgi:hypothetical protein
MNKEDIIAWLEEYLDRYAWEVVANCDLDAPQWNSTMVFTFKPKEGENPCPDWGKWQHLAK